VAGPHLRSKREKERKKGRGLQRKKRGCKKMTGKKSFSEHMLMDKKYEIKTILKIKIILNLILNKINNSYQISPF
jgi:hypothetical protein